ncbi:50S ribosomal protein L23 [Mycoplasma phocoenae]|uniref:Large ribosomal subunit protein uL23 n=1 Tax=Mycoplasma phocoenae TaxID=754517 RepID=A0A858U7A3_9MOLU|nr:50S ribosomal protein L23 [Mycoplasma phocoenae]QJG67145.1 50S ribosomal protein L23 [Mycoplasma phocoenae]
MKLNDIIKYPILTEKTYQQMSDENHRVITFAVDKRTNKVEVRKAVEFIFNVKVEKVNILKVNRKAKRVGRFSGYTSAYKKAMVFLAAGSEINFFPEDVKSEEVKETKAVATQNNELSDAEKKAAEKIKKAEAKKAQK